VRPNEGLGLTALITKELFSLHDDWDFGWGMNEEADHQGRELAQLCLSPRLDWACEPTKQIGPADRESCNLALPD